MGCDEHGPAYPEPPITTIIRDDNGLAMLSEGEYSFDHGKTWHKGDALKAAINRPDKSHTVWNTILGAVIAALILTGLFWVLA